MMAMLLKNLLDRGGLVQALLVGYRHKKHQTLRNLGSDLGENFLQSFRLLLLWPSSWPCFLIPVLS